jgi:hypothetical protein
VDAGVGRSKYGARSSYSESAMTGLFSVASDQMCRTFVWPAKAIVVLSETCEIGSLFIVQHGLTSSRTELDPCQANTCLPFKASSSFDLDSSTAPPINITIPHRLVRWNAPDRRSTRVRYTRKRKPPKIPRVITETDKDALFERSLQHSY